MNISAFFLLLLFFLDVVFHGEAERQKNPYIRRALNQSLKWGPHPQTSYMLEVKEGFCDYRGNIPISARWESPQYPRNNRPLAVYIYLMYLSLTTAV